MTASEMVKILVDEKKAMLKKYENKVNEVKKLQDVNKEISVKCAELSNKLEESLKMIDDMKNESIEQENKDLEDYINENNRLNTLISEIEKNNTDISAELENEIKENEKLSELVNSLTNELNELKNKKSKKK